jgi:sporulation protein YlmC with PRC-barrel domain
MLHTVSSIKGYLLAAQDGHLGKVKDIYLEEGTWAVRYFVVNTGTWLPGRDVLLPPRAIGRIDDGKESVEVHLTKEKIKNAPDIGFAPTVSRQMEHDYYAYYDWPAYWTGFGAVGAAPYNVGGAPAVAEPPTSQPSAEATGVRLRGAMELTGYHVEATDGEIGHVEDFVVDDDSWEVRYIVVDTRNWWPGKKVMIPLQTIEQVSWDVRRVFLVLTRDQVQNAPEFVETFRFKRDLGDRLDEYYRPHFRER